VSDVVHKEVSEAIRQSGIEVYKATDTRYHNLHSETKLTERQLILSQPNNRTFY